MTITASERIRRVDDVRRASVAATPPARRPPLPTAPRRMPVTAATSEPPMNDEGSVTGTESMVFVLIKLGRILEREVNRVGSPDGLTASHSLVLGQIARRPRSGRAEVARGVHVSPQAVGGALTQLQRLGMVARSSPAAGRQLALSVTDRGMEALEEAEREAESLARGLLASLRPEHRRFLDGAMRHLLRTMERDDAYLDADDDPTALRTRPGRP
jgi:DNA-binding MarR family transcriptional regulator